MSPRPSTSVHLGPAVKERLGPWSAFLLGILVTACDPEPLARMVDIGQDVDEVFRLAVADHGNHAFVVYRKNGDGSLESLRRGSLAVLNLGTWSSMQDFSSEDIIGNGFSCADERIVAFDVSRPMGNYVEYTLEVQDIAGDNKLASYVGDCWPLPHDSPWGSVWPHTYECDPGTNTMYFRLHKDRVIAIDGSSGQLLREYLDPGQTEYFNFFIQPERDRLVWVEYQGTTIADPTFPAEVRVYGLASGELTGVLEVMQGAFRDAPAEYLYLDTDHIAMLTGHVEGVCNGITIKLIELSGPSIEQVRCIQDRDWGGGAAMGHGSPQVVVGASRADGCWEIRSMDLETGEEPGREALCSLAWPGYDAFRSADRIFVSDTGGGQELWWLLDYPGFETVAEGAWPTTWDAWELVESEGWLVQQSYHTDDFGLFDLADGKQLALGPLCDGVVPNSIRLDPTERWAMFLCSGDRPGLAVVDLDRYREVGQGP